LLVVGAAAAAGEANATTVAEVLAALDDVCVAVAGNASALCELFVNVTVDGLLPFLDKQLNTLAWPIAQGVCSLFVPVCFNPCCDADYAPEQLRLALTGDATEMRVSWVTLTDGCAGRPPPSTPPPACCRSSSPWKACAITPLATGWASSPRRP
jgi:hypothetical protein